MKNSKQVVAVYPGSFDPVTIGHLDIIQRASNVFDQLIVAVANNVSKSPLFAIDERKELLMEVTKGMPNVIVESFQGLLIEYMRSKDANIIVRGLRAVSDYEYELQMALAHRKLGEDIETFFMTSSPEYSYLSSSIVKEIAKFHGPVGDLVAEIVEKALIQKYSGSALK